MCKGLATLPATCLKSAKDIKHKLSFLLQKQDPQDAAQKQTAQKEEAFAKSVPAAAELEQWKESFSHVMNSQIGQAVFTDFLRSEFSQENMEFWVACEDFRKSSTCKLEKMEKKAKTIYQQYVAVDSPNEVNLDAKTREETRQNIQSGCLSCFDEAQKKIYLLMEKDSYRRFLKSKLFQDLSQGRDASAPKIINSDRHSNDTRKELAGGA